MKNKIIEKYRKEGIVIPGTYDAMFKAIMQDKSCREYLIEIIYNCTKLPKKFIRENLIITNSELPVENFSEKRKITDLVIEIGNNIINLEMNCFYYNGLIERNETYLSELKKIKFDYEYEDFPRIIQINFDNFYKFDERTIIKFMIMDEERHVKETENYEKYHINLKRIKEKYYNKEELTKFEKLLLLLVLEKKDDLIKVSSGDEIMKKVEEKIITLSQDSAMILCYDEEEYKEKVRKALNSTEKEQARKEGLEEGRAEGRAKGLAEGHIKGMEEGKKEIIKKLIDSGMDEKKISNITGMSIESIKNI